MEGATKNGIQPKAVPDCEMTEGPFWTVSVDSSKSYEVRVAESLVDIANESLLGTGYSRRRFVIVDDGVPAAFRDRLSAYFKAHRFDAHVMLLPGGEPCKQGMDTVIGIVAEFESFGLDRRNEPVIIIGGGAVLDVGGLAASVYRRGVPFVRVPTTLLSYVDASVGIKTGVNFGSRKNLIGTFASPQLVLLDREFLRSLPKHEIASGLGEILKLGVACDVELFTSLETKAATILSDGFDDEAVFQILQRSITVMLRELAPNLFEGELCRTVDMGHTFSQVFEMLPAEEALRHGEAVALDVNLSAVISFRRGLLPQQALYRLARLTERLGLPMTPPRVQPSLLWDSLLERTRHRAGRQRVPLPVELGKCIFVDDITLEEISDALHEIRAGQWRCTVPNKVPRNGSISGIDTQGHS